MTSPSESPRGIWEQEQAIGLEETETSGQGKVILGYTPLFHQKFVGTFGENSLLFLVIISQSKLCDGRFDRRKKLTICFTNHQNQVLLVVITRDRLFQTIKKVSTKLIKIKMRSITHRAWQPAVLLSHFPRTSSNLTDEGRKSELAKIMKFLPSFDKTGQLQRQFFPQLKSSDTFLGGFIEFGPKPTCLKKLRFVFQILNPSGVRLRSFLHSKVVPMHKTMIRIIAHNNRMPTLKDLSMSNSVRFCENTLEI